MHFTLALFQRKEMVNHLHSKPLAVQLVYQKRLFFISILAVKVKQSNCCLKSLAINKNRKPIVFWRSANLENCPSTYTPQRLSRYHQAQYASHTNQYLIQYLQLHAKSHQPGQLAASSLLRRLLVETVKYNTYGITSM